MGPHVLFLPSETCFMVRSCGHISQSWSWFTVRSLRCEVILYSCQNISLLRLWGHYGLKSKVQPFYTEALIYLCLVQTLHLFWRDQKLLGHWPLSLKPRHRHVCVNTAGSAQGLRADFQVLYYNYVSDAQNSLYKKTQIFNLHPGSWRLLLREVGTNHCSSVCTWDQLNCFWLRRGRN